MFFAGLNNKTQKVCRGAKIIFWQFIRVSKKGFRKKMCTFCFCLVYVGKSKKDNMKKDGKENFKKTENSVFGWLWRKMFFFVKMSFSRKIGKHYLCSDDKKQTRIFVATICFWKMVPFFWPFQVRKHYKNRGFSRHRGKHKMALSVAKVPFWEGAPKGVLLSVIPTSCALLKTLFL